MFRLHLIVLNVLFLASYVLAYPLDNSEACFPDDFELDAHCTCSEKNIRCFVNSVDNQFWKALVDITKKQRQIEIGRIEPDASQPVDKTSVYFPNLFFRQLPSSLVEVKFKDLNFRSIPHFTVPPNSSLTLLEIINDAVLDEIESQAFSLIKPLEKLYLFSNNISVIHNTSFNGLSNLRELRLNDNALVSLPDNVFKHLYRLTNLTLASNKIDSIRPTTFTGLENLVDLELNLNHLFTIKNDTFRVMARLLNLDLSHNHIDYLEQAAFRGLHALENLDLSHNNLRSLPDGLLQYTSNLREIDLKFNSLSTLNAAFLGQLPKIAFLKNNSWICDCPLKNYANTILYENAETQCEFYGVFNAKSFPVKPENMTFKEYIGHIDSEPKLLKKCSELEKTIDKRSHEVPVMGSQSSPSSSQSTYAYKARFFNVIPFGILFCWLMYYNTINDY